MNNKPYLLALNRMMRVGPKTIQKLRAKWPNLEVLFQLTVDELKDQGLPQSLAESIKSFDLSKIEADIAWENASSNRIITIEDSEYPSLLKEIYDPPTILYVKGDWTILNTIGIAVIGSRHASVTGLENAYHFSQALNEQGLTIISGLAEGIDGRAHAGALANDGKTIGVMATGINRIYPTKHQSLATKMIENGALVTEFPLDIPPMARHFPRRNRIISGLSVATLVVEASIRSGTLITARYALEHNREVLAIPSSIHNPMARGCHHLLQQGAKLVTSVADVLNELPIHEKVAKAYHSEPNRVSKASGFLQWIGYETTSLDKIASRSGLSIDTIAVNLADLECQGLVVAVPGGYIRG